MIKKIKNYSIILITPFLISSCASILNSKFQKVTINTDEKSTVLIDGRIPKRTEDGKYLISRDAKSKQITVIKEGFKDENLSIIQYRRSPYYAMSIVPFAITLFPPFYDNMIRSRNYLSELSINQMIEIPNKDRFSSVLKINKITTLPNNEEEQSKQYIQYRKFVKNKSLSNERNADISISSNSLKSNFIALFEKRGYITSENNDLEKIYFNAIITNRSFKSFGFYTSGKTATQNDFGEMLYANLIITWEVLDNDKNILFTYQTDNKSGQFAFYDKNTQNEALSKAIKDAIEIGFLELIKTDEFTRQLDKRSEELTTYLSNNNSNKIERDTIVSQNYIDTIVIENKDNILYLSKKNLELRATFRDARGIMGAVRKKSFLEMVEDVPELHTYAKLNIGLKRNGFALSLVKVYNDYKLSGETKELNQDYYNSFGLITKKEYQQGPREEILKTKLPISGQILHYVVRTDHYSNGMKTGSTTGENFKFKFTYGNTEYKKGILLKNLRMAIGDDKEALKHIRKYRANWASRQLLKVVGVSMLALSLKVADGQNPFGISSEATPFIALPSIGIFSWAFGSPQRYKTKNITNAINTYNKNLK